MTCAREIELKLDVVQPESVPQLEKHPLLRTSSSVQLSIPSIYFDTDGLDLRDAGFSLRIRRTQNAFVQTIKSKSADLFRGEWEQQVASPTPDLTVAEDTPLAEILKEAKKPLKPKFETKVRRSLSRIQRAGSDVEIALDTGEISTATDHASVCELELELKGGQPGELFRLARELSDAVPLLVTVTSKAERGYELLEGANAPKVEKALPLSVPPDATAEEAFRLVGRNCIRQVLTNRPGTIAGHVEALHQMRVGLRRLRSAISVFDTVVDDDEIACIKRELKWITRELGPPRDLDVLKLEVLDPLFDGLPREAGRVEAQKEFNERRQQAHKAAATSIQSARFMRAILDIVEWIEAGGWSSDHDALKRLTREMVIDQFASGELARRRKKILKQGKRLNDLTTQKRHKLRIRAKKLRYASEFFRDVFPGKKKARKRKLAEMALKELQSALGELNDISARERMMSEVTMQEPISSVRDKRKLSFAAGIVYGSQKAQVEDLMHEAKKANRKFAETKAFWK